MMMIICTYKIVLILYDGRKDAVWRLTRILNMIMVRINKPHNITIYTTRTQTKVIKFSF